MPHWTQLTWSTKDMTTTKYTDALLALTYEMRTDGIRWKQIARELNVNCESLKTMFYRRLK